MRASGTRALQLLGVYAVVVFLMLPQFVAIGVSFNPSSRMTLPTGEFSLRWYRQVWNTPEYLESFTLSMTIAVLATIISLILGGAAAFGLVVGRRNLAGVQLLMFAPLVVPGAAFGAALFLFMNEFLLTRTMTGVLIGHVIVTLPYTFRTMHVAFKGYDSSLTEAAQSLGAGTFYTLRRVILPIIRPGLLSAALFSFIVSLDEFTITLFLSGGSVVTFPLQIYNSIQYGLDPSVAAASTLLIAVTAVVIVAFERFVGLNRAYPMG